MRVTGSGSEGLRVGCVQYLNAQPLIHGWQGPVIFGHPSSLCRQLAAGELDVALVSSFEFLRAPLYQIVDGVAVGSDGAVHSVFLVYQGSLDQIETIDLDPASSTSVNLLRCLVAESGRKTRFETNLDSSRDELQTGRAKLMIGDAAIQFRAAHGNDYNYWDLGAEWEGLTGFPFVFALWLIRPEVANPALLATQLRAVRDRNLANLDGVIRAQKDFSADFCSFYFRECLQFGFGEPEKAGLLRFRTLCEKHGLLPPNTTPLRLV